DGDYTVSYTPTAAGTYRWVASYPGDSPNTNAAPTGGCNDANESGIITPKAPSITQDASADPPTGGGVGTAGRGAATLTGTRTRPNGDPAGGTITFNLYGPDDLACSSGAIFTSAPVPVHGDGTYSSGSFTPLFVGTYRWVASYSGDLPNTSPVSGM